MGRGRREREGRPRLGIFVYEPPEFPVTPLQIFEVWQGYLTDDFKSGTLDGVWGGYAGCGDIVLSRHTGPLKHLDRAPKCEAVLLF